MSEREFELAERYAELRLQCAMQRRVVAAEVENLEARFVSVDRVAIMARGRIAAQGTLDELRRQSGQSDLEELFFELVS